jgi:CRISPR-associated protein Cas2
VNFRDDIDLQTLPPRTDVLDDLLPVRPHAHPPGLDIMLRLIAYDISDPKRWRRIRETCEDYGVPIQYSLFECWLEEGAFLQLWETLQRHIDPKEDRLVAYTLDQAAAKKRRVAGDSMSCTQEVKWYIA